MNADDFYDRLCTDFIRWAERLTDIRLMMVVGSRARQIRPADLYSDLDLSAYVSGSPDRIGAQCLDWLRACAPIWMILDEHHDDSLSWLILYQGGIKVDFSVTPIHVLHPLIAEQRLWDDQQRGYRILLDKDGIAARLPAPTPLEPPPYMPPNEAQFIQRVNGYFYGAVYLAKQIRRGNLWKAKWADQIQQTMLLEMLEWHAHATHEQPVDTYHRGDFMGDWVSDATWREVHNVFAHFDATDSRKALLASIRLFTRLTEEAAAKLGYDHPRTMVEEVTAWIEGVLQQ